MKAQRVNSQPKVADQDSNPARLILEQIALTIALHSLHFGALQHRMGQLVQSHLCLSSVCILGQIYLLFFLSLVSGLVKQGHQYLFPVLFMQAK